MRPLATLTDVAGTPVLDWVKLADDGSGDLIVRLYEAAGGDAKATLRLDDTFAGCTVEEVNLMEEPVLADDLPVRWSPEGRCPLRVHPSRSRRSRSSHCVFGDRDRWS